VPEHVRVDVKAQLCPLSDLLNQIIDVSFAKTLSGLYFQSLPQAARRS